MRRSKQFLLASVFTFIVVVIGAIVSWITSMLFATTIGAAALSLFVLALLFVLCWIMAGEVLS